MSAVWRKSSGWHKICSIQKMLEPSLRFAVANLGGNYFWGLKSCMEKLQHKNVRCIKSMHECDRRGFGLINAALERAFLLFLTIGVGVSFSA